MHRSDYKWKARDYIFLTREDCIDFSRLLLETWPNIRFVPYEHWDQRDRVSADRVVESKDGYKLYYYDCLWSPPMTQFRVWLEPEGWKPKWRLRQLPHSPFDPPDKPARFLPRLVNQPRLQFTYFGGGTVIEDTNDRYRFHRRYPTDAPRRTVYQLASGRLMAQYKRDDVEHRRFLNKVWRLSETLTTNEFVAQHPFSKEFFWKPGPGGSDWAGRHAVEWLRQSPDHYLDQCLRPADEHPDYEPRPPRRRR